MNTKGQKGFAIVNIIMGVVLTLSGFIMFRDPSIGASGIILLVLGALLWGVGAWTLNTLKNHDYDEDRLKKSRRWNTVCFVFSCLLFVASMIPVILYM